MLVSFPGFLFYKLPVDVFCLLSCGDYSLVPADFQDFCEYPVTVLSGVGALAARRYRVLERWLVHTGRA